MQFNIISLLQKLKSDVHFREKTVIKRISKMMSKYYPTHFWLHEYKFCHLCEDIREMKCTGSKPRTRVLTGGDTGVWASHPCNCRLCILYSVLMRKTICIWLHLTWYLCFGQPLKDSTCLFSTFCIPWNDCTLDFGSSPYPVTGFVSFQRQTDCCSHHWHQVQGVFPLPMAWR